jgi:hypothetical protein
LIDGVLRGQITKSLKLRVLNRRFQRVRLRRGRFRPYFTFLDISSGASPRARFFAAALTGKMMKTAPNPLSPPVQQPDAAAGQHSGVKQMARLRDFLMGYIDRNIV